MGGAVAELLGFCVPARAIGFVSPAATPGRTGVCAAVALGWHAFKPRLHADQRRCKRGRRSSAHWHCHHARRDLSASVGTHFIPFNSWHGAVGPEGGPGLSTSVACFARTTWRESSWGTLQAEEEEA